MPESHQEDKRQRPDPGPRCDPADVEIWEQLQRALTKLDQAEQREEELRREIERLRARTHEIAEAKDAEHREALSDLAQIRQRIAEARERTKDWNVDWTTDPPSQEPGGWWSYASSNQCMDVVAILERAEQAEQQEEEMRRERDEAQVEHHLWRCPNCGVEVEISPGDPVPLNCAESWRQR